MNSVSERSRVRLARSLSGAAEGRRDDASDLCIDAELNSVSYLQLDLPPWQRRVSVDSGSIAGVVVDEQRTSDFRPKWRLQEPDECRSKGVPEVQPG